MGMERDVAVEFLQGFAHPVLLYGPDRRLVGANPAAEKLFGVDALQSRKCHELLHGKSERCAKCPVHILSPPFAASRVEDAWTDVATRDTDSPCVLTTGALDRGAGKIAVYKVISEPPRALVQLRRLHDFAIELESQGYHQHDTLVAMALRYLVDDLGFESVRYWEVSRDDGEAVLVCRYQRNSEGVAGIRSLVNSKIRADSEISWWAIRHRELTYVTNDNDVMRQLCGHGAKHAARPERPFDRESIALLYYDEKEEGVLSIYDDDRQHSWLDLPLIEDGDVFAKISVSHPRPEQPFERDECQVASLFSYIINQQLARNQAIIKRGLEAMAWISHELRQPAELASHSVSYLRSRLMAEKNYDTMKQFVLRSLESALALIRNLNDAQMLTLSPDSRSTEPVSFINDILHPIVDMIRHAIYVRVVLKRRDELKPEHLREIGATDNIYSWGFGRNYRVEFEEPLRELHFYLRATRLQEICYNLLLNALKYSWQHEPLKVKVQRAYGLEYALKGERDPADYHIIQFVDYGRGINDDEAEDIFEAGKTGSASRESGSTGTGVGLYLARAIARGFGGDLLLGRLRDPTRFDLLVPWKACEYGWWEHD